MAHHHIRYHPGTRCQHERILYSTRQLCLQQYAASQSFWRKRYISTPSTFSLWGRSQIFGGLHPNYRSNLFLNQSFMLTGYSTVLYFAPTLLCLIPSLYWHVGMLAAGSLLRSIFLFRNYSQKIPSKSFAILIVILLVETLFVVVVMRVLFENNNGHNFSDGTKKVFDRHALRNFFD